jgi:hypothetical protein
MYINNNNNNNLVIFKTFTCWLSILMANYKSITNKGRKQQIKQVNSRKRER